MKTSELIGAQLDWAVAKCEGENSQASCYYSDDDCPLFLEEAPFGWQEWMPSINWSQAGPIIEREKIDITTTIQDPAGAWRAAVDARGYVGDTPLVAAMRCYVASKLGEEIEIPEELL